MKTVDTKIIVNTEDAERYFRVGGNFVILLGRVPASVVAKVGSTATLRNMLGDRQPDLRTTPFNVPQKLIETVKSEVMLARQISWLW